MRAFIITGSSYGIGKALTEILLKDSQNRVLGISRTQSITHQNYSHQTLDLNEIDEIESFDFPDWIGMNQISLIHNAGWIGPIQKIGNQELGSISSAYIINLIAPASLSNKFIKKYKSHRAQKIILSISSGAAKVPIAGWNSYCSAKAGLDMLSKCISLESPEILSLAIAPGKVDTEMQSTIRYSDENEFPRLKEFQQYYKDDALSKPTEVAEKYKLILDNPEAYISIDHLTDI